MIIEKTKNKNVAIKISNPKMIDSLTKVKSN